MLAILVALMVILGAAAPTTAENSSTVKSDSGAVDTMSAIDSSLPPAFDTTSADTGAYEISIGRLLIDNMRLDDTLDVLLHTHGRELGAFDIKIAVDNPIVDIVAVLPGDLQETCGWEYFNARPMATTGREGFATKLWQVVAIAQTVPGPSKPTCYGLDGDLVMLRLVLSNEHVMQTPDQNVPIFFFWEDCTDNTIADRSGEHLLISRHVYDYYGATSVDQPRLFPTRIGAPAECIKRNVVNPMRRLIDFHNGGVEFLLNIEPLLPADSSADTAGVPEN